VWAPLNCGSSTAVTDSKYKDIEIGGANRNSDAPAGGSEPPDSAGLSGCKQNFLCACVR
jgi:hypothetical protein